MIIGFVGTPGSGKTYEAVKKIIDNLKSTHRRPDGRFVVTNIEGMDDPACQQYIKDQLDLTDSEFEARFRFLTPDESRNFFGTELLHSEQFGSVERKICPSGCLIVLDEIHKLFNSRDWQSETNRKFSDWASTHRHEGYDLVMVTQDIEKVDKQCRSLIEWTYFFRKINFLGSAVTQKYLCYSYTGDDHKGKPLSKATRTYDPAVFPCYKSYSTSDAKEVGFMKHVNILKHPVFFIIPVVIAFCIYMMSKSSLATGDLFGTKKKLATIPAATSRPVSAPVSAPGVAPPAAAPAAASLPVNLATKPSETVAKLSPDKKDQSEIRKYYSYRHHSSVIMTDDLRDIPKGIRYKTETFYKAYPL